MKPSVYLAMVVCFLAVLGCVTKKAHYSTDSTIAVTIPYDSYDSTEPFGYKHHRKFHVLLTNVSSSPVRVWQEWCSWGYYCLQIELMEADGTKHLLKKKRIPFYANFPDYVALQSGESVVWNVDLSPSIWTGLPVMPTNAMANVKIRAIYTVTKPDDTEVNRDEGVAQMGVWTGQSASDFCDFTLYGPNSDTPK